MLSFQGYFDAGRFVSPDAAVIPERKRAIITIQEDTPAISNGEAWDTFLNALDEYKEFLQPKRKLSEVVYDPELANMELDLEREGSTILRGTSNELFN
jgi:hypothetical protein